MSLWSTNIWQSQKEDKNGIKIASSINGVGRSGQVHVKNETRHQLTPYTKRHSWWIEDLNMSWHHKIPRGEHRQENFRYSTQ